MLNRFSPLVLAAVLCSGSATAMAPAAPVVIAEVVEAGLAVVMGPMEDRAAPNTAAGRVSTHDGVRFVRKTNLIPAKLGTSFGFSYRLSGIPASGVLHLEMRAIHPPMKGPDGQEQTVSTAQFPVESLDGLYFDRLIYTLSEPFEVVPGKWTLQIRLQGRELISREFVLE